MNTLFSSLASLGQQEIADISPEEELRRFIQQVLQSASSHPHIHAVLALEAIQNQGKYYQELEVGRRVYEELACILERGVEACVFRPLNPQHPAVNILATCVFYFIAQGNLQQFFQLQPMNRFRYVRRTHD